MRAHWVVGCLLIIALARGASAQGVREAECNMFSFDATRDSPHIEILDFRYGTSAVKGTFAEPGKPAPQHTGVAQGGIKGDRLFVKWRNKNTNKILSEDIQLKGNLPSHDNAPCDIFFAIKGDQLYVFLMTDKVRPKDFPPVDTNPSPLVTDYVKVFIVYPYGRKTVD